MKWLRAAAPTNERLVGSADIQSLADLANSYEVVRTMSFALARERYSNSRPRRWYRSRRYYSP